MSLPVMCLCFVVRVDGNGRQVLLGEKLRGFGQGRVVGPGGKVEPGETPRQAAVRELREETGLTAETADLRLVARLHFTFPHRREWSQIAWVYIVNAADVRGTRQDCDELRTAWVSVPTIPYAQMWSDAISWLPRVLKGKQISARFWYGRDNATVSAALRFPWKWALKKWPEPF